MRKVSLAQGETSTGAKSGVKHPPWHGVSRKDLLLEGTLS